jgi:hypothetical protein
MIRILGRFGCAEVSEASGPAAAPIEARYEPILFDLQRDPRELQNLAGTKETAVVQQELHAELLRMIPDPDAITEKAFAAQQALLEKIIRSHTRQEFYEELRSRLGAGQARVLANQFYRGQKG